MIGGVRLKKKFILEARVNEYAMRGDNTNVPWTADEIAETSARVREEGAAMLHFHARNADGSLLNTVAAYEGSQYVVVCSGEQVWVLSGDVVYTYANLQGDDAADPYFVPPGLATGSQTNLILAAEEMIERAGGELRRIVPVHEERLKENFSSRISDRGLRITEIALAKGETSRVA
jgi:uncharacterized protein (DUF849 family)